MVRPEQRHRTAKQRLLQAADDLFYNEGIHAAGIEAQTDPRDRILAVYDVLGTLFAQPDYRGCAFVNAMAEAAPDGVETQAATIFRAWVRDLFLGLATDAGAADPQQLAETLVVLYDGAVATSQMDKAPQAAQTARRTAELVLDNAGIRAPRRRRAVADGG
jgi:AcrR family transcriptional regulator